MPRPAPRVVTDKLLYACIHRRLCAHRRRPHGRTRLPRRFRRLALLAAFRLRRLLRRAAGHARQRPLADLAGHGHPAHRHAPLSRRNADSRNRFRHARRRRHADRLHAAWQRLVGDGADRGRQTRYLAHEDGTGAAFRLRLFDSVGRPAEARQRHQGDCRAGHRRAAYAGRIARRRHEDGRRIHGQRGRARAVFARLCAIASAHSACARSAHLARSHRESLARMVGARHHRGPLGRADPPLADHAEGARL
jgi:hypothetical protein